MYDSTKGNVTGKAEGKTTIAIPRKFSVIYRGIHLQKKIVNVSPN